MISARQVAIHRLDQNQSEQQFSSEVTEKATLLLEMIFSEDTGVFRGGSQHDLASLMLSDLNGIHSNGGHLAFEEIAIGQIATYTNVINKEMTKDKDTRKAFWKSIHAETKERVAYQQDAIKRCATLRKDYPAYLSAVETVNKHQSDPSLSNWVTETVITLLERITGVDPSICSKERTDNLASLILRNVKSLAGGSAGNDRKALELIGEYYKVVNNEMMMTRLVTREAFWPGFLEKVESFQSFQID